MAKKSASNPPSSERKVIHERGLDFDPEAGAIQDFIVQIINKHKWEDFAQSPGNFVLDFVTEFYQNMNKEKNENIVKGKNIDFSPEKVNEILNLQPVDDSAAQEFFKTPNLEIIEEKFCHFGANWGYDARGNKIRMRGVNIGCRDRVLLAFISRFIPNSNSSKIYLNRITLLYAVSTGLPLDIGKLINENMKTCECLGFPSTITKLCAAVGLKATSKKLTLSNKWIGDRFWSQIDPTDGPKRKTGEGEPLARKIISDNKQDGWPLAVNELKNQMSQMQKRIREEIRAGFGDLRNEMRQLRESQNERFDRAEHIDMQKLIYSTSLQAISSNLLNMFCSYQGFTPEMHGGPSHFPYFTFVDPSTFPIPQYINMPPQNPPSPPIPTDAPPPPNAPLVGPEVSTHSSNNFADFLNLGPKISDLNVRGVEPISAVPNPKRHRFGKAVNSDESDSDSDTERRPKRVAAAARADDFVVDDACEDEDSNERK